jgi:hypothetical protein
VRAGGQGTRAGPGSPGAFGLSTKRSGQARPRPKVGGGTRVLKGIGQGRRWAALAWESHA